MSGFYGKSRGNLPVNIAESTVGSVPTQLQDQHTELLFRPFLRGLGQFTLTSPTIANNRIINVSAGHGLSVGNLIYIANINYFTYSTVTAVNTNAITLSCPVDKVFSVSGTICGRVTDELAADGSTTNLSYVLSIPIYASTILDITKIIFQIEDNAEMDDSKFGAMTALTNGLLLRSYNAHNNDGYYNYFNIKKNGDLKLMSCNTEYSQKAGGGNYAFDATVAFAGQENAGCTIRLSPGSKIEILVQDNLTSLVSLRVVALGHFVDPNN